MAKVLLVIAEEGYQDIEYNDTKKALEDRDHQTTTSSTKEEAHGKLGGTAKTNILLKDIKHGDYDAIAFIGGPGCNQYFNDKTAHQLAKDFYKANKPTCAICAAPSILANAGLLERKTTTCFEGESQNLQEKGAIYTGNPVEQDGLIITGNGPGAAKDFGKAIANNL